MQEMIEQRELVQSRVKGRIFRFTKRFYRTEKKVLGVLRVFDGPQESQGFYITNDGGHQVHFPQMPTWAAMEKIIADIDTHNNGGQ